MQLFPTPAFAGSAKTNERYRSRPRTERSTVVSSRTLSRPFGRHFLPRRDHHIPPCRVDTAQTQLPRVLVLRTCRTLI